MEKIEKVWFEDDKIFIETNENKKYSIPLEVFPTLKDASAKERDNFYIWDDAQSIRWEYLDEDIHISSSVECGRSSKYDWNTQKFARPIYLWSKNTKRQYDAKYQRYIASYRQKIISDSIKSLFLLIYQTYNKYLRLWEQRQKTSASTCQSTTSTESADLHARKK